MVSTRYACEWIPADASATSKRPLLLWFHAAGRLADDIQILTSLEAKTTSYDLSGDPARPGFVLVSVQGRNLHWPSLWPGDGSHHDFYYRNLGPPADNPDIANTDELIDAAVTAGNVDPQRIYVMGWSNGMNFAQLYGIARHATATPGGNRVAAVTGYSGGSPFGNVVTADHTPSCQLLDHPTSDLPILIVSRDCDTFACNEQQWEALAGQGSDGERLLRPGAVAETWVATLTTTMGDPNVVWLRIDRDGVEVESCAASCAYSDALQNHQSWPNGVWDNSGIDYESEMLDFLAAHPLT